ncbi:MAG: putative addiction module antidote protein [Elusimicrobiaceae bacterium]|nr:putative addiction module antidote protein [Elusimicrobiaceae bacterium]
MKKQNKLKLSAAQLKKLAGYADFEEETAQELKNDLAAQKAFLKVALDEYAQDGNQKTLLRALGLVLRARGMSASARKVGVSRNALYQGFSEHGNPRLDTFLGALHTVGAVITIP